MASCTKQKRAALLELKESTHPSILEQGGSRGQYIAKHAAEDSQRNAAQGQNDNTGPTACATPIADAHPSDGATTVAAVGNRFHAADVSTFRHLDVCRHLDGR